MPDLILYGHPRSTNTRTVMLVCEEKGIPYELRPPAAVHPFGKMPAAVLGDVSLFESLAISVYLDETFGGPRLVPTAPVARAVALQWTSALLDYAYHDVVKGIGFLRHPDAEVWDQAEQRAHKVLGPLDAALSDGPWFLGEGPTLPDLALAPMLAYLVSGERTGRVVNDHPNLVRALEAMAGRPSFVASEA